MKQIIAVFSLFLVMTAATLARADITIGVNVSSTGPAASLGMAEKNALLLGPATIAGQKVNYVFYDDASDTTTAVQNVKRLITEAKADVIIGPTTSPTSKAVIDIAADGKTPIIQLSPGIPVTYDDPKRRWIFNSPAGDAIYAETVIRHMTKRGVKTVSVIAVDDAYGENTTAAFRKLADHKGLKVLTVEKYKRTDTSATTQVLKAMQGNPDAVYIASSGTPGALPHVALVERGYKGKIYQSGGSANAEFLRVGGKALEGSFINASPILIAEQLPDNYPAKKESLEFIKLYEAKYGVRNFFASLSWNALRLVETAIPKALKSGAKPGTEQFRTALRDALEATSGLRVAGAVVTMSKSDHTGIDKLGMCVIKIDGGKWKLEDLADF